MKQKPHAPDHEWSGAVCRRGGVVIEPVRGSFPVPPYAHIQQEQALGSSVAGLML